MVLHHLRSEDSQWFHRRRERLGRMLGRCLIDGSGFRGGRGGVRAMARRAAGIGRSDTERAASTEKVL